MQLFIKNMVCDRCVSAVKQLLDKQGLRYSNVQLGEIDLPDEPGKDELEALSRGLNDLGFELLDNKKARIVERIKSTIISMIHHSDDEFNMKISAILEEKLGMDYHYLTSLFSSVESITIERFVILQRIEKVKELLTYNETTLSDIAFNMGYSSVQHLSQQFKKITGMTPSQFKSLRENLRKPIDKIS